MITASLAGDNGNYPSVYKDLWSSYYMPGSELGTELTETSKANIGIIFMELRI